MGPDSYKRRAELLLRSLFHGGARIRRKPDGSDWPAYSGGDRRKRVLFWVNCADVEPLLTAELLKETRQGIGLSDLTRMRMQDGASARRLLDGASMGNSPNEVSGSTVRRGSAILLLSARKDASGDPVLTAEQVTAAQRYAMDLLRSGEGHIGTVDFGAPRVDGTRRFDRAENAIANRLDGHRRLKAAREAIGEDFARLMNAVCGSDHRLESIERLERWPAGTGLQMLRIALNLLVRFYGTQPGPQETGLGGDGQDGKAGTRKRSA